MPTTEILVAPLKPGSEIGDPSNPAAQVLQEVGSRLSQTDGVHTVQFGTFVENPSTFQLFVNWDKLESHQAFTQTEVYKPFLNRFLEILEEGGKPTIIHADLKPEGELTKALSAPVTEVATFYFGGEAPSGYEDGVHQFRDILEKENAAGYLGAAVGVTHEDDVEREGVKGKAAVLTIGWQSVDAHMAFRETSTFKDNIHLLRNGVQKVEMHHTQFMSYVPE